ncbi:MAG TPA: CpsD/CapB family tyrosine-protein kinase [Terriglobales bacterium]|nr:CpsD/CapB family tyrosine-protein kinase [Terriglobales bacterium]
MSRVFEALQEAQRRRGSRAAQNPWELPLVPEAQIGEDPPLRTTDTRSVAGATEAGLIAIDTKPENRVVALSSCDSLGSDKFRFLASQLRIAQKTRALHRIVITSSVSGEGKSLVCANLGIALAKDAGQRTLLIDADHRRGTLTELFNSQSCPGLRDWSRKTESLRPFVRRDPVLPLWFLPTGIDGDHLNVKPEVLSEALAGVTDGFDVVLIDSPPLVLADATIWMTVADTCLLIARQGKTPKKMLTNALSTVPADKVLGIVLNECRDSTQKYYHEYYRRGTSAQSD